MSEMPSVRRFRDELAQRVMFCPEGHGVYVEDRKPGHDYPCPTCERNEARTLADIFRGALEAMGRQDVIETCMEDWLK
jgi:hypothetical protein